MQATCCSVTRWTPSQSLAAPLDPSTFKPLSPPFTVWHIPAAAVTADVSGVAVIDVELLRDGPWCGMLFWADLQLFGKITYKTSGQSQYCVYYILNHTAIDIQHRSGRERLIHVTNLATEYFKLPTPLIHHPLIVVRHI